MRYSGQSFELSVPVPLERRDDRDRRAAFRERLRGALRRHDGGRAVEIVSYRVAAWGLSEKPVLPEITAEGRSLAAAAAGTASIVFGGHGAPGARVPTRRGCPRATTVTGPALIEEAGSSTVVPPGWTAAARSDRLHSCCGG